MVKALKTYLIGCMLLMSSCFAVSNQELFLRGNKAYKAGCYQDALREYEAITSPAWAVYANKGNCLYALGLYADALVEWQSAYQCADRASRKMLTEYIGLAQKRLGVRDSGDQHRTDDWGIPLVVRQLVILLLALCSAYAIRRMRQKRTHYTYFYGGSMLIGVCAAYTFFISTPHNIGIVVQSGPIIIGRDQALAATSIVNAGDQVSIVAQSDGWYKIKRAQHVGWMPQEHIRLLS